MPRKIIVPTKVNPQKGIRTPFVAADAANGMEFFNNGSTLLLVRNRDNAIETVVTIFAVPDEAGRAVNYTQAVTPNTTGLFGPYKQSWWNQTFVDSGYVWFSVSSDVNVSVSAITLF